MLAGTALALQTLVANAAGISVGIDASAPVHLSREAASVVVGNPSIADVYIQNGKLVFLSGRSFGTTNLIALDAQGQEILNVPVTVTDARGKTVTLQRGAAGRISYACAGRCEPSVMPGDDPDFAKNVMEISNNKASAADAVAKQGAQSGQAPD
jgi:Pilus formation protein N terminal region